MVDSKEQKIIDFIRKMGSCSSTEVFEKTDISVSYATIKRLLSKLKKDHYITTEGQGKSTRYILSPTFKLIEPINLDYYFQNVITSYSIHYTKLYDYFPIG